MPPIPPIPPMPPMPPADGESFFGSSTTMASVVSINEATPDESTKAVLTTLVGSIIPYLIIST